MQTGTSRTKLDPDGEERFVSLRRALGVTSFGINQLVLEPRQRGRIHRHERQEEVYFVLEGTLTLVVEGEEQAVQPGELGARSRPQVRRQLVNRGPGGVVWSRWAATASTRSRRPRRCAEWDDDAARGSPSAEPVTERPRRRAARVPR